MVRFCPALAPLLILLFARAGRGDDWPQYGGPQRTGVSEETGLLREWPEGGPPLLWHVTELGGGPAPVSVVGSRLYTLAFRGNEEFVVALDRGAGKELWATSLGVVRENPSMLFLRQRQPTVDGDRLYAFSTLGHLACLETDLGKELWRKRYLDDFGGRQSPFGWTDYPLVDGDRLVCTPGGKDAFHVALDKRTGEVIWKSRGHDLSLLGLAAAPSHSPLVAGEAHGVLFYVQNLSGGLAGFSAADGRPLWTYPKVSSEIANVATPVVRGALVFAASGYQRGCALLKLSPKAGGGLTATEVYHSKDFHSFYGGMVPVGDYVYAGNSPTYHTADPSCFDWRAGKLLWRHKGPGQGAVATIAADGHLYFRFADGLVVLAEASPEGFKEKGRLRPSGRPKLPLWSVPVVAHGRLFLRDQSNLYCYDLRRDPPRPSAPVGPDGKSRQPDAVFIASPPEVVARMLAVAKVGKDDVVYDLGSGDGRVVIAATKRHGARRGVGVELDAELVARARESARREGVEGRVTFREQDLFAADFQDATVVTLYLLPHLNAKLLPKLMKLRPGTRIVAYANPIPGVEPDEVIRFEAPDRLREHTLYLWTTPLRTKGP